MKRFLLHSLLLSLIYISNIQALTVDGDLSDWGVTPGTDYTPNSGIVFWEEDSVGSNGYVGPGWGGQGFDFEAFYAYVDESQLFVAIVTGMPEGGTESGSYYYPGDLSFDLNGDGFFEYGLELTGYSDNTLGGEAQNGEFTYDPSKKGNLYKVLDNDGWNQGYDFSELDYRHTELNYRSEDSLELIGSTVVEYVQYQDSEHYVVETVIDISDFDYDLGDDWTLYWALTCSNDVGGLTIPASIPLVTVPEPTSVILLGLAIAGLAGRARKSDRI